MDDPFRPAPWARNRHLQTLFGSLRPRVWGKNEMVDTARQVITDAGNGVRLLGYLSRQSTGSPKGMIILLHGWEGSADSAYILSIGRCFYRRGYDIFRLNLRDHGNSHYLNLGLFHGALIDETSRAVDNISHLLPEGPSYLIGFSLGGNFALRIALRQSTSPISNLKQVFCISPALDPYKSTLAIDAGFFAYRWYFLSKWKTSLRRKQRCFPDHYHFADILHHKTCLALTEAIMPYFPEFESYDAYFQRYTLTGPVLSTLAVPVTVFISQDDPVVAAEDFYHLPHNKYLRISIQKYGGHCGFLNFFPCDCWYEQRIVQFIERE